MIRLINKNTVGILKKEVKKTKDEKYKTRLKAIVLIKNGKTRKETAGALVVSLKSVTGWVKAYKRTDSTASSQKRPAGQKER